MEVEDEAECRRKLDQRKKKQKEQRDVDRMSFVSKETKGTTSCKRWRKGVMISCLSTRRCKEVAENTKHPGQKKNLQKDSTAAEEEMRKQKEERVLFQSKKSTRTR